MTTPPPDRPRRRHLVLGTVLAVAVLTAGGCSSTAAPVPAAAGRTTGGPTAGSGTSATTEVGASSDGDGATAFLDAAAVHGFSMSMEQADYDAMLAAYRESGAKKWIEVTVEIDGTTYRKAGARLKGNSSLRSLGGKAGGPGVPGAGGDGAAPGATTATSTSAAPESLPWLVRLDKYVNSQDHHGTTEFVIRSNSTSTALNEAVSLDLLRAAGLASQRAALVRFRVNDSAERLRLVIENPGDDWQAANFDAAGILYKAEADGDYTYRGEDWSAYDDVFDQETGSEDDLRPLVSFLDFVNNSDDATFAAELGRHLDVDAFARYLAFEDLIGNFDDIDGPGNNSYLYWDRGANRFTVVAWDHNLAFGVGPGGGAGGAGGFPPGGVPGAPTGIAAAGAAPPAGVAPPGLPAAGTAPAGAAGRGPMGRTNPLVQRFNAVPAFAAAVTKAKDDLRAELFAAGVATSSLDAWKALVAAEAGDLVDAATLEREAAAVAAVVT